MAIMHNKGYICTYPTCVFCCFVLDNGLIVFQDFKIVKTKAYEYAIINMSALTARHFMSKHRREDMAKLENVI